MGQTQKTWALWAVLLVGFVVLFQFYNTQSQTTIRDFSYRDYVEALKSGKLADVTFRLGADEIAGEIKGEFQEQYGGKYFLVTAPVDDGSLKLAEEHGITPNFEQGKRDGLMGAIFLQWLPLIIIIALILFILRQVQVGGGKAMNFGKSRARLLTENNVKVTFQDVAGVDEAKEDLMEIVQFLKDPKKFTRIGGRIPKGLLLVGSPGTGKTLLARAIAGEAGVPFFTISGSDFVEMFVGVGASRVRDLFEQAKKSAPCLVFIDEIDAVGRHRGAGMGVGHDEREQTLNQLLVEMDGFEANEGVILIAATNRPDVLDPALRRPGRFDRQVIVNKPDLNGRRRILEVHTRKVPLAENVDLEKIARGTPGFTGADLENLVNEAALIAGRFDKPLVSMQEFEYAKDKVMMGGERKSMVISEEDKRITAWHEAGHALVAKKLPKVDPVHKVTIIPRGMAAGVTQVLPTKESLNLSKEQAEQMLAFMFGGRAAEAIVFGDFTTGAGNDIERATDLARRMVCEWGMSEKLGPLAYEKREGPVFLGKQSGHQSRDYSEAKAQEIDVEVHRLITNGYDVAAKILTDHREILDRMAESLLEHETIDGDDVDLLIQGGSLESLRKTREQKKKTLEANEASARKAASEREKKEKESKTEKASNPKGDPVIA